MTHSQLFLALTLGLTAAPIITEANPPGSGRLIDLNGDQHRDRLINLTDGTLRISLGIGGRQFEEVEQELPRASITDCLATDLNGDGFTDLYLITGQANLALVGDGQGLFSDATLELGLADEGCGTSVEYEDLDRDGFVDLLVHNRSGDVLFWGTGTHFERDETTLFVEGKNSIDFGAGNSSSLDAFVFDEARTAQDPIRSNVSLGTPEGLRSQMRAPRSDGAEPTSHDSGTSLSKLPLSVTPIIPIESKRPFVTLRGITEEEKAILDLLSIESIPDGLGGTAKTLRLSGANLQVVNGLGATNGNPAAPGDLITTNTNAVGNLIVGYNELGNPNGDDRTGSHNLIVGQSNSYTGFGGLVTSRNNGITSPFATVSGGHQNISSGISSSISGGFRNIASGNYSSVSGGFLNHATGAYSSVSGGSSNDASGTYSSVSGGQNSEAYGARSSVSGGSGNLASGPSSSVSGGDFNYAVGTSSTVSGGSMHRAYGASSSISGGLAGTTNALYSSVSGGSYNRASAIASSVSGGRINTASGFSSTVGGGFGRSVGGTFNWASGSLFESN